jgi:hypothetical protein
MKAAVLCREMKWSWGQYCEQPQWFVMMLHSMLQEEAAETKRRAKQ